MSVTVDSIFIKALALIDELMTTGTYDNNKVSDYKGRTPSLVDMIQKELYRTGDLFDQYELSRYPTLNLLGDNSNFDVQEFKTTKDLIFEATNDDNGGVRAYYFECDSGNGTAYIEDYTGSWNTLATILLSNTGSGFVAYKGAVTPTSGATQSRIRFSGSYYYKTINRALFNFAFETGKIPDYQPWVKVALPTEIKSIDKVITEFPDKNYTNDSFYKVERIGNRQYLYLDYYFQGKVRVQYKPIPATISAVTDSLEIDDITAQCIAYKLASIFMASEQNEYLAKLFGEEYQRLKSETNLKQAQGETEIEDYYGTAF